MATITATAGLPYILWQNTNASSSTNGKYYARSKMIKTIEFEDLITHIAEHGSVYGRSIVAGVMYQMQECLIELLQSGNRVEFGDLGAFRLNLRSAPADSIEDFTVTKNIKGVKLNFTPNRSKRYNYTTRSMKEGMKFIPFSTLLTDNDKEILSPATSTSGTGA